MPKIVIKDLGEIARGDAKNFKVRIKRNGAAMDLSGFTAIMTAKLNINDADTATTTIQVYGDIASPETGEIVFPMSSAQTEKEPNRYDGDVRLFDAAGRPWTPYKIKFEIIPDYTRKRL